MEQKLTDFVHARHVLIFSAVAREHKCHILVRRTGPLSIRWVGVEGYTGKRADMKAKTAKKDVGPYVVAGLVCSPFIHPGAHRNPLGAKEEWAASEKLITVPRDNRGFDDQRPVACGTPYVLQNNPKHKHYGCVAWVEGGLIVPRYVHGDYDLYAIVPAGRPFDPDAAADASTRRQTGSTSLPKAMGLQDRLTRTVSARNKPPAGLDTSGNENQRFVVDDQVGPLSFRIATDINNRIAAESGSYVGALMVNHGEQINIRRVEHDPVLAFLAEPRGLDVAQVLENVAEQKRFFANA